VSDFTIRVVTHLPGEFELRAGDHPVVVERKSRELPPLNPPDSYVLEPLGLTRIRITGNRLDLSEHEELIAEAIEAGAGLEFHLVSDD
jgi:hypothetical protein